MSRIRRRLLSIVDSISYRNHISDRRVSSLLRESAVYADPADHSAAVLFERADIRRETVGYHMFVNRTARATTRPTACSGLPSIIL